MHSSFKQIISFIISASLFLWSCSTTRYGAKDEKHNVSNVHFKQKNEQVFIYYDLAGISTKDFYDVHVSLTNDQGKKYKVDTTAASGDIGPHVTAGKNKKITWNLRQNYPNGLDGKQFQFMVTADESSKRVSSTEALADQNTKHNNNWIYYTAAGSLVLGIGTALMIITNSSGSSNGLPAPPSHPSQ